MRHGSIVKASLARLNFRKNPAIAHTTVPIIIAAPAGTENMSINNPITIPPMIPSSSVVTLIAEARNCDHHAGALRIDWKACVAFVTGVLR